MVRDSVYRDRATALELLTNLEGDCPSLVEEWAKVIDAFPAVDTPGGFTEEEWRTSNLRVHYAVVDYLLGRKLSPNSAQAGSDRICMGAVLSERRGFPIPGHFAFLRAEGEKK